jgi:hypothetical protein
MVLEAGVVNLFRTLLILVGVFVLLRFIGRLMAAKRNLEEDQMLRDEQKQFEQEIEAKKASFGKTSVLAKKKSTSNTKGNGSSPIEDVEYEEIG